MMKNFSDYTKLTDEEIINKYNEIIKQKAEIDWLHNTISLEIERRHNVENSMFYKTPENNQYKVKNLTLFDNFND